MRRFYLKVGLGLVAVTLLTAYDTAVISRIPWQSIYQAEQADSIPEHTNIADDTFDYLDPSGQLRVRFGRGGTATLDVVDLNASHFRHDLLYGVDPFGDDEETEAEERTIPSPGLFAGLPDYSYAIYDWLNKNQTCPAFPDEAYTARCHEFMGWLGAMNSVHFGSQAEDMYAHLHTNALRLAEDARDMREAMSPAERIEYAEEIEEAELLALAYEGYAQHFIQDRWAMGHMWERWAAPDPTQQEAILPAHLAIGALAGLVHGAEAVVQNMPALEYLLMRADPMSSPLPGPNGVAVPMEYRHVRADGTMSDPIPAVGDERYADMISGQFSLNRYDPAEYNQTLNVPQQIESMRFCTGAGWAEVIRTLGPGDEGGYSSFSVPLGADAPTVAVLEHEDCWNNWATNESMALGFLGPNPGRAVAVLAAIDLNVQRFPDVPNEANNPFVSDRTEVVAYATRIWLRGRDDPHGTEVSRGTMESYAGNLASWVGAGDMFNPNSLWGFQSGNAYELPNYVVPVGLESIYTSQQPDALPDYSYRGRDIQTLYGVFSGVFADHWCEHTDVLSEWRVDPNVMNREMCEVLGQRIYNGTHPSYEGSQSRERRNEHGSVRSMCSIREVSQLESDEQDDRDNPYWLDQGYVPVAEDRQELDGVNTSLDPVVNWCARTPVIALDESEDLNRDNIAVEVDPEDVSLRLSGWDLGLSPGEARLTDPETGQILELDQIVSWTDAEIHFDISDLELVDGRDYTIELRTAATAYHDNGLAMVGLAKVRVTDFEDPEPTYRDLAGLGPCRTSRRSFTLVELTAYLDGERRPEGFTRFAEDYARDTAILTDYLTEEVACMRQLRETGLPILRAHAGGFASGYILEEGVYRSQTFMTHSLHAAPLTGIHDGQETTNNFYDVHIDDVDGLIWYLERANRVVQAWDRAMNGETTYTRRVDVSPFDLMQVATSVEETLRRGFIETEQPDGSSNMPPGMGDFMAQVTGGLTDMSMSVDLYDIDEVGQQATEGILAGLEHWTQVEDTTRGAIVELEVSNLRLLRQFQAGFQAALADGAGDYCAETGRDPCDIYVNLDEFDFEHHNRLLDWMRDMHSSLVFRDSTVMTVGLTANYVDEAGNPRFFKAWPGEFESEAARLGPN